MFNSHTKCVFVSVLISLSACANAQDPQNSAKQFKQALDFIDGQLGSMESIQAPPSLSDPETRASYDTVSETMEEFGTASFPADGVESMHRICRPISEVMLKYIFNGTSVLKTQQLAADLHQHKLNEIMLKNSHMYQSEIMILTAAHVRCSAVHVPEMSKFIQNLEASELTETRKDGLKKMGAGAISTLIGLATYAADPGMSVTTTNQALALAVKYAPELIVMTSLSDRKSALAQFDAAKPFIPQPYLDQFTKIREAFTNQNCTILCWAQD